MMAIKIDLHKGIITHEEFMVFIKGGASLDLNAVTPKPFRWILDITWLNLVEINKLAVFNEILDKVGVAEINIFIYTYIYLHEVVIYSDVIITLFT